ncbi:MAG: excinuclease ABC subunit UvrC, partial [Acidimicrobiia bacterium]
MLRRPPPSEIPDGPGVYLFRDQHGAVLYVGKAKSLRKRLANYFAADIEGKTAAMVDTADSVEWIVTPSEVDAIMVEYSLVHEHQPRYNIRLKDDKSFPYLALTMNQEWPRAMVVRGKRRKGVRYFGPYAQAYAIRQTLDLMLRTFPVRTCTDAKFRRHEASGRPCLLFHIEKCAGPCVGEIESGEYEELVAGMTSFFRGNSAEITEQLQSDMEEAAANQEYERAARIRDQLTSVGKAMERQELVTEQPDDFDVIAVAEDELEAALVVLHVRRGRVTGRKTTIVDRVEEVDTASLIGILLTELYGNEQPPREVLVEMLPDDPDVRRAWLHKQRGSAVSLRVPKRGAKRRILETAAANAAQEFSRHRLKRHTDHNARARALNDLQEALALPEPPLRIECYDISTIQGTNTVASMVVFEDGLPKKSDYRRFKIRTIEG